MLKELLPIIYVGISALAAVFALLAFFAARRRYEIADSTGQIGELIRSEFDRNRAEGTEQARVARQELAENLHAFQSSTLQAFTELGRQLGEQSKEFGRNLDGGLNQIGARTNDIGTRLERGLTHISELASQSRQTLEGVITERLVDAATKAETAARDLREEVLNTVKSLQDSLVAALSEQRSAERDQFESFTNRFIANLDQINEALRRTLADMSTAADARYRTIVETLDAKITQLVEANSLVLGSVRSQITDSIDRLAQTSTELLGRIGTHQNQRLEDLTRGLGSLAESQAKAQESLRATVESRLDAIRSESATKLEDMRRTVDEKLQSTLEKRLGESFRIVSEQLDRVYQGLGEMQTLAAGVGDLKRVLSNVKVRGTWGEIQLGNLLEQFLAREQYVRNAQVRDQSSERVEFAIRLPGIGDGHEVLLPIDSKFPQEDFDRLTIAAENGDAAGVENAASALEERIRMCAKSIREKYINPPRTTDIAILFLPTESLYAEALRRPGLFESLQREYHVTLAGPTTLTAILNALQTGFRSLAIEKRSSEVWQILGAIRTEFSKYGEVVDKLHKQLNTAVNTIDSLGQRTRTMNRKLRAVETLPESAAQSMLGIGAPNDDDEEEGNSVAAAR